MWLDWRERRFGSQNLLRHSLEKRAPCGRIAKPLQVVDECEETFKVNNRFVPVA
jgi:hypothetical protein